MEPKPRLLLEREFEAAEREGVNAGSGLEGANRIDGGSPLGAPAGDAELEPLPRPGLSSISGPLPKEENRLRVLC